MNNNININNKNDLNDSKYMTFPYHCNLCNHYPIIKVLHYSSDFDVILCQNCHKMLSTNHKNEFLKIETKQELNGLKFLINKK